MSTSWQKRSLGSQAAVLALGAMFTHAATLASLVVLTRLVSKPVLGSYQELWLIYGILSPFLVGGLPTALLFFVPRTSNRGDAWRWIRDSYLILGAFGLVSSLLVLGLRHPLAAVLNNPALAHALLFYVPYPFFAFLTAAMPSALIAGGRAGLASLLNALNGVLTVVVVVAAAEVAATPESLAAGLSLSAGAVAIVSTTCVVRAMRAGTTLARGPIAWRPLLGYGLPMALTQLAAMLGFQFDRLVVGSRFAPSEFAVYALGAVEVPIAIVVQQAVNAVLVPEMSRSHADGDLSAVFRRWHAALRKTSLVVLPLFAFLMFTASDVIAVLYGSEFSGSVRIFRAYLFLMPLRMTTYGLITQAMGRTRVNLAASIVMLATNAAFAVVLVFPLGLLGPAISTPLAMLATVAFYVTRLHGLFSLQLTQLVPVRLLAANVAVSFASALPLLALPALHVAPVLRLVIGCIVFVPLYVALLRVTGRLTPTEWSLLRARMTIQTRGVSPA
jgi:O-antigen/teichoic acid export membrane protein